MSEIQSIKKHARQAVDHLDLHGTPAGPPEGLEGEALKEWIAEFYAYGLERGTKRDGAVMALVSAG